MKRICGMVGSVLLYIALTVICLLYTVLIVIYVPRVVAYLAAVHGNEFGPIVEIQGAVFSLLTTAAFHFGLLLAFSFLARRGRDEAKVWRMAVLAGMVVILVLLAWDSPPPAIKYTRADLAVPAEVAASYDTLMLYRKGGERGIDAAPLDLDLDGTWPNLIPAAGEIEKAWENLREGRDYLERLDQFPGVTDLGDDVVLNWNMPIASLVAWRNITRTHAIYAILKVQQGEADEGLKALIRLHSVIRKRLPYSTTLVDKMINISMANQNLVTVNLILQNTTCTPEQLQMLKGGFPPLRSDQVSLRRTMIAEFLQAKDFAETMGTDMTYSEIMYGQENRLIDMGGWVLSPFLYDRNETIADLRDLYAPLIDVDHDPLAILRRADACGQEETPYFVSTAGLRNPRNLLGSLVVNGTQSRWARIADTSLACKVKSDLLALEIGRCLGDPLALKDVFTDEAYPYDETAARFFGAGRDAKTGTDDDIYIGKQE